MEPRSQSSWDSELRGGSFRVSLRLIRGYLGICDQLRHFETPSPHCQARSAVPKMPPAASRRTRENDGSVVPLFWAWGASCWVRAAAGSRQTEVCFSNVDLLKSRCVQGHVHAHRACSEPLKEDQTTLWLVLRGHYIESPCKRSQAAELLLACPCHKSLNQLREEFKPYHATSVPKAFGRCVRPKFSSRRNLPTAPGKVEA